MARSPQGRYRHLYPSLNQEQNHSIENEMLVGDTVLGQRDFGRATVNCCLRAHDCTWGRFKDQDTVVLVLLTDQTQERGFKLHNFTIRLSFTEHNLTPVTQDNIFRANSTALQILEPPSPSSLKGGEITQHLRTEMNIQPEVSTGPANVKVGQVRRTKERDVRSSWHYHGHRHSDEYGVFTIAKWVWEANTDNPQIEDVSHLYSGLILRHAGEPFYVGCTIRGQLVQSSQAVSHFVRRWFKFGHREGEEPTVTKIMTRGSVGDLEVVAKELEEKIVRLIRSGATSMSPQLPSSTSSGNEFVAIEFVGLTHSRMNQ